MGPFRASDELWQKVIDLHEDSQLEVVRKA
jgi:hypothetical protein